MRQLERQVVLSVLDRKWREHLYEMDYLREGIGLRGYGQRDPLVEYQREGYDMFSTMMDGIKEESVGLLFNLQVQVQENPIVEEAPPESAAPGAPPAFGAAAPGAAGPGAGAPGVVGAAPGAQGAAAAGRAAAASGRAAAADRRASRTSRGAHARGGAATSGGGTGAARPARGGAAAAGQPGRDGSAGPGGQVQRSQGTGAAGVPAPGRPGVGQPGTQAVPPGAPAVPPGAPAGQRGVPAGLAPRRLQYSAPSVDGGVHVQTSGETAARDQFARVGRNDPCPCGSGRKFKRCHGDPRTRPDAY